MSEDTRTIAGRYTIIRPLGRGGMGEVYLASDTGLDRKVAIKYLRGDLPEGDWGERMHREARLLAQLNHPNIVQIHDIVDAGGVPAMVMEYVDGRNLFVYLREHRVELPQRLHWLAQIASGIAASHAAGISHRDLKAENVLIGPGKIAKVTDFGIAAESPDLQADIEALGNLAEAVLAEHTDALAPTVTFLLERLLSSNRARRPSAAEAAQELQLAYYESTQAETPLPGDMGGNKRRSGVKYALLGLTLATLVLAAGASWYLRPVEVLNVAVAPARLPAAAATDERQARLLRTALNQSLRQIVIDSPGLALVRYSESELDVQEPAALLALLAADSLIIPQLDCSAQTCELSLDRLEAPDASVARQFSTTLLLDSVLDAAEVIGAQWPSLFPESRLTRAQTADKINEEDYRAYLDLYLAYENNSRAATEIFSDLQALIERAPAFAPAYRLLADTGNRAYQTMSDSIYLDALEQALRMGEGRLEDPHLLDFAWFERYSASNDAEKMSGLRQQIIERNPDPVLASILQGRIDTAAMDFAAAAESFARALRIQPTSENYYRLGRSQYFAGNPEAAVATLEALVERYPYHANGLNLLAIIQFERWDLDSAISNWEYSLEVIDDPLVRSNLGSAYLYTEDYELAREHFTRAIAGNSQDAIALLNLADAQALLGNSESAESLYRELLKRHDASDPMVFPEAAAQAAAHLGYFEQALTIVKSEETDFKANPLKSFSDALVYTLAGQKIAALVEIDSAIQAGLSAYFFNLPWFDPLCEEPRFNELMQRGGNDSRCTI